MPDIQYDGGLDLHHGAGPARDSVTIQSKDGTVTVRHVVQTGPGYSITVMALDAAEAVEFAGAVKDAAEAAVRYQVEVPA